MDKSIAKEANEKSDEGNNYDAHSSGDLVFGDRHKGLSARYGVYDGPANTRDAVE